jgi:hypothetical protein
LTEEGDTEDKIAIALGGDRQLVKMWVSFLVHNNWVAHVHDDIMSEKWIVTDKGKIWIDNLNLYKDRVPPHESGCYKQCQVVVG